MKLKLFAFFMFYVSVSFSQNNKHGHEQNQAKDSVTNNSFDNIFFSDINIPLDSISYFKPNSSKSKFEFENSNVVIWYNSDKWELKNRSNFATFVYKKGSRPSVYLEKEVIYFDEISYFKYKINILAKVYQNLKIEDFSYRNVNNFKLIYCKTGGIYSEFYMNTFNYFITLKQQNLTLNFVVVKPSTELLNDVMELFDGIVIN